MASTVAFYRDVLGFALMAQLGAQAAFLSAGGYHHHLGANIWESRGAGPPPPGSPRCATPRSCCPTTPSATACWREPTRRDTSRTGADGPVVRDPSGNALVLAA